MNKKLHKIAVVTSIAVVGLSLVGCELIPFKQAAKLPLNTTNSNQSDEVFHQLENKAPVLEPTKETYLGTDRYVSTTPQKSRAIATKGSGSYSLNFDDADLGEVAKVVLSDILGQSYVLSPKVTGKVTLQTTEPLTKEELLPALEMVLRMNNAALVKDGKIYHIEPTADALFTSDLSAKAAGYQTRVIPVKNVAVQDIVDIIKPLVHDKTILNVDGKRNILVASGTADEIARVIDMINTFDIDVLKGRSFGLFTLVHVDPETMIKELQGIFSQKGKGSDSDFFQFIPIKRLNAVLAVTRQAHYLDEVDSWVVRLDKVNTSSGGGVNVYKVQHADAKKLAATLNQIFASSKGSGDSSAKVAPGETAETLSSQDSSSGSNSSSLGSGSGSSLNSSDSSSDMSGSTRTSGYTNDSVTANLDVFAANGVDEDLTAIKDSSGGTTGSAVGNIGKVKIIPDIPNNSIIIVASAQDYETILPVITQLDVMPLQVLIDATVVEVKLTNDLTYGISWYLNHTGGSEQLGGAATAAAAAAAAGTGGFSALYSSGAVKALLNTEAKASNLNVISSPSLMVLNNEKAKINVGQQVPIQTSTSSLPVSGGGVLASPSIALGSSIQYKDTGVTLEVTPRVNANGMVNMKLKQVVSNVVEKAATTGVTSSATFDKKEITSSVAVNDGETIVLGGLIADDVTNSKSGFPLLNELPYIGSLFGNTKKGNIKTELVVLITPRVVKSKQDSRTISGEFKRKLTGIYQDNDKTVVKPRQW